MKCDMDFFMNTLHMHVKNDNRTQRYPLSNYMLSRYSVKNAYFDMLRIGPSSNRLSQKRLIFTETLQKAFRFHPPYRKSLIK